MLWCFQTSLSVSVTQEQLFCEMLRVFSTVVPVLLRCLTYMLCFLEEITKWIDKASTVDIIYLDFQKAFDKVPHQRLLLKLKAHAIEDGITDWIEQWLTDRRQLVVVGGEVSNWKSSDIQLIKQRAVT